MEILGSSVKLISTDSADIDRIIEFEKLNKTFVHQYSKTRHESLLNEKDCLHLSVKRTADNELLGHLIAFGLDDITKILEFRRIVINKKGKGYGREAISLLKKLCFEVLGFHRLWLDVYDDNTRAIALYESQGFVLEGTLRDNIKSKTGFRSQRIYSMLENEYKASFH